MVLGRVLVDDRHVYLDLWPAGRLVWVQADDGDRVHVVRGLDHDLRAVGVFGSGAYYDDCLSYVHAVFHPFAFSIKLKMLTRRKQAPSKA